MSKRQLLIILGVWVMVISYLGFPASWDRVILVVSGFVIVFISYRMKPETRTVIDNTREKTFIDSVYPGTNDKIS